MKKVSCQWWEEPLRIADIILPHPNEIQAFDAEDYARTLADLNFNCQHLGPSTMHYGIGGEETIYYFKTDKTRVVKRDFLKEYIPFAQRAGINLLIYLNVHWYDEKFVAEHPDWMQKDREGLIRHSSYGVGGHPCVNSPWRDWFFGLIRDISVYDIKGIFLDGPIFLPDTCYCEYCQKKFRELYDKSLPETKNISDPNCKTFIEFRYASIAGYLKDAREALKEEKPEAIVYMNGQPVSPGAMYARDNRRLFQYQDIVGAEGGFIFGDLRKIPVFKPGMTAKLLETQAEGKPRVVFIAGRHMPWTRYLLTKPETKLLFAEAVANGANPWYGIYIMNKDGPGTEAAKEMNAFFKKRKGYFEKTESLAKVALVWSTSTSDWYNTSRETTDFGISESPNREQSGDYTTAFKGYYDVLVRSHIPFDVIDEYVFRQDRLKNYDLIILPNCACLSSEDVENIKRYVWSGGNLIATFETSIYDEFGQKKDNFQLNKVFGANYQEDMHGPSVHDYIVLEKKEEFFKKAILSSLLPAPQYGLKVVTTEARRIGYFLEPMSSRYTELSKRSQYPAILLNQYGKGRCLYFAGTFDEHFARYQLSDYLSLLGNPVKDLSEQLVILENCYQSVELILRAQPDRLLIHLINFTGEMTRPIQNIIPLNDIIITINKKLNVTNVKALMLNKDILCKNVGEVTKITLPVLSEYEVIVIDGWK